VIANFLDSHADFSLDDLASELPASTPGGSERGIAGTLMTLPHRDRTAGFFIARLRKA
jgi:16S rRNA (cytosine967-C5)-methyltransferase